MRNKLQPTRTTFSRNFHCKKAPRWRSRFFHFGTENGEEQLKKAPSSMKSFPVWKRRCWDSVYSRDRAGVSQVWWHNGFNLLCGSINTLDKQWSDIFLLLGRISKFADRSWFLVVDKGITSQFDVCINWGLYLGMGDLILRLHNSKKMLANTGNIWQCWKRSGGTWRPLTIASFQTFQPAASC